MNGAAIRVRHLWHRFGRADVLRDVTFDVGEGEIFGFIGPNGAGKTTTIRVMATLLEPMAGRVEIDGLDVTIDPDEVRRRIGYMADHAGVYEQLTVREYLEFFADAFEVSAVDAALQGGRPPPPPATGIVDTVLELTDMTGIQERIVATMSKGMKQRLQLGRILLHDPKVLILDEPASDLDPRARIEIRDLLLELRGLGKTIFLSSHILTELADVCTSVAILERGQLVVAGPIHSIGRQLEAARAPAPLPPDSPAAPANAASQQTPHVAPLAHAATARVKVRVLGDPAIAARLIQGGPGIASVEIVGGVVVVTYAGNDVKIAEIVQHLVMNRVGVVGVEPERSELERIFLEVTRREGPPS